MPNPIWYPDEIAHAGEEHLDPAYIAGYDAKSQTDPSEDVALLRELGLGVHSVVVDLGAGTGTFALAIAPYVGRVVAVDVSPAMLAVLREHVARLGLTNVEVVQGGFLSYAHSGKPADAVYSRNALHHLPDFWKGIALVRITGMLRPGGLLRLHDLVYDFDPHEAEPAIEDWLAGAQPTPRTGWTREELETHLRTEHSTYRWLLEQQLLHAGFEIRDVVYRRRVYAAYTCVKRG